ncbi:MULTISPECIES: heme oxygenase [Elizabethkingia]|uniref:heme oxygenase n=1 Tax=Elizabethkingia TaxID=308865 RepID=UPI000B03339E|nr:heme oxygenase [Elizabethkingia ursingii]MCT3719551.1 heme oxygenase [Elizabethkingia anophelis]MCT3723061.1 heme oxygenase [Elizabethkingia anophelis]MCT3960076.1 heme oxygenase [Elizabethkingia anophelis]MCT4004854.1 heme oxygenase [Elizabethkingia anophelis]MCT4221201.1 heme oxygenase [Elizabethkingia anophelis]
MMKNTTLYLFKNSVTKKIPLFKGYYELTSLNDIMASELFDIEVVTECIVEVPDDFEFEDYLQDELIKWCEESKNTIDHNFIVTCNDYDVI